MIQIAFVYQISEHSCHLCTILCTRQFWGISGKFFRIFGVPDEFQLEHPANGPENPRNPAPELHSCVGSTEYGPDSTRVSGLTLYPYQMLNRLLATLTYPCSLPFCA